MTFLGNIKIGVRLACAFTGVILCMLVALGIGLWGQNAESRQLGRIGDHSRTLAGASHELTTTSGRIASAAGDASGESERVATAAEEVSRSVQTVAAGTEQMNAAIREISGSASNAARVAATGVDSAREAGETIGQLGRPAPRSAR